jgi:hypothetical protein
MFIMKSLPFVALGVGVLAPTVAAQAPPSLPEIDRVRITEAFRLADAVGNQVWPGWDKAPFAILLVTPDHEFLIRHPKPAGEFKLIGEAGILKHKVWFRKRQFSPKLLATFPAVGGVPTIVVGQAENTEAKTSTRWVITLLHEHFHQLQNSQPRYYAEVDALGLAKGDQTGMWMLNYAFAYTNGEVKEQFAAMAKLLVAALQAKQQTDFDHQVVSYVEAKKKLRTQLKPDDYKYLAFQAWQEGIARYTEYHIAKLAAEKYEPTKEFRSLKDYTAFKDEARAIRSRIEQELGTLDLAKAKRIMFYPLGAAEGLVLDRVNPTWRSRYFEEKFCLDKHFRPEK